MYRESIAIVKKFNVEFPAEISVFIFPKSKKCVLKLCLKQKYEEMYSKIGLTISILKTEKRVLFAILSVCHE